MQSGQEFLFQIESFNIRSKLTDLPFMVVAKKKQKPINDRETLDSYAESSKTINKRFLHIN